MFVFSNELWHGEPWEHRRDAERHGEFAVLCVRPSEAQKAWEEPTLWEPSDGITLDGKGSYLEILPEKKKVDDVSSF